MYTWEVSSPTDLGDELAEDLFTTWASRQMRWLWTWEISTGWDPIGTNKCNCEDVWYGDWHIGYTRKNQVILWKKKLCSSFMSFVVLLTTAEVQLHPRAMKHHDSWSANRIESEKGLCILNYVKLHVQSCSYHLSVFESFGIALELLNPLHTVILRQRSRAVRASSERGSLQQQIPQLRTGNKLMEHNSVANVKLNCLRCVSSFHA